ncbi:Flp pilus assembly protein CpaB [Vibrio salinus]|uniref:Flp pilus assembly protein CpaB n=1 Tax=Vibrio salinus TaxID=2899784 RepID=UPI001E535061|nr:Flp pilus assembly protein CpaB [Vibrio salinus]MCE0494314.1 Flp pilus assembly protein CpaB [Vibrio salinus]
MSKNQVVLLLILSVLFGLGAVFFAKKWMDTQVQPQVEVERVEREPVVVAAIEIPEGTIIEEQELSIKLLEKSWRNESQFSEKEQLIGRVVGTTIFPDEMVTAPHLAPEGEGSTLAHLLPEDKRAVTIRVNDVIGVAGFLLPGNKVDVLSTVKRGAYANTRTVLKDIKVLAVDQTARTKENKPIIVRAVTLEVSPKDAEKLLSANSRGNIQLALRNPEAVEPPAPKYYAAPSVTIIKGTDASNVRVRE